MVLHSTKHNAKSPSSSKSSKPRKKANPEERKRKEAEAEFRRNQTAAFRRDHGGKAMSLGRTREKIAALFAVVLVIIVGSVGSAMLGWNIPVLTDIGRALGFGQ